MEYEHRLTNIEDLPPEYDKHVMAMTEERLHSKADIACELAYRDERIAELEALMAAKDKAYHAVIDADTERIAELESDVQIEKLFNASQIKLVAVLTEEKGELVKQLKAVREAIEKYYLDLDNRQHGGIAEIRAFQNIEDVLGMRWVQGEMKAKVLAEPESG